MTQPGWYPDPSGASRQQRWWDGARWSPQVRPEPGSPRGRGPWLIAVAVVLVVALVAWAFLARPTNPSASPTAARPASPTGTAWDENPTPDPSGSRPANCNPGGSGANPSGTDQLTLGRLRLTRPSGWTGPSSDSRMPFAQTMWGFIQRLPEKRPWASSVLIGVLDAAADPNSTLAARTILQCLLTSGFYANVSVTLDDYRLTQVSIDGAQATQADASISFSDPQLTTKGSRLRLIIVETTGLRALFFAVVPKENAEHLKQVDQAVASLRLVG